MMGRVGNTRLTVDCADRSANVDCVCRRSREAGFVPYVTVHVNARWEP